MPAPGRLPASSPGGTSTRRRSRGSSAAGREAARDDRGQPPGLERLRDEVEDPLVEQLLRGDVEAVPRAQDRAHGGVELLEGTEALPPAHPRHDEIDEDQVD